MISGMTVHFYHTWELKGVRVNPPGQRRASSFPSRLDCCSSDPDLADGRGCCSGQRPEQHSLPPWPDNQPGCQHIGKSNELLGLFNFTWGVHETKMNIGDRRMQVSCPDLRTSSLQCGLAIPEESSFTPESFRLLLLRSRTLRFEILDRRTDARASQLLSPNLQPLRLT